MFDNSVYAASRLSMRLIIAIRIHDSEVSISLSQSLLILRRLFSHASVRSTAQRFGRSVNSRSPFGRLAISSAQSVSSLAYFTSSPAYPPFAHIRRRPGN